MGKKSRRKPRQVKLTLDDLDDDTTKPTPPPDDLEIYIGTTWRQHEGDHDKVIASFKALPEREKQAYAMMAKEKRVLFDRRVAFCAKSGPDLVGELFLEATTIGSFEVRGLGACKPSGLDIRVVGLNHTIWEASHRDKDVRVYEVVDEGETRPKELISLRELRARACGDARAARKAARRSYRFVSWNGFDESTGTLFRNGRFISNEDFAQFSSALAAVDLTLDSEYSALVLAARLRSEGKCALKAIKKWPRIRPYWKRVRRRICVYCARHAYGSRQGDLSAPRYLVCSGCGDARYCSEACQRADWARHQKACPAGRLG